MRHGRQDEALRVLRSIHSGKNKEAGLAEREYTQIKAQSDADDQAIQMHGKYQLLTQATYRKRLIVGFLLVCNVQSVGILVVISMNSLAGLFLPVLTSSDYGVALYTQLGLRTDVSLALIAVWILIQTISVVIGNLYVDRIGRRICLSRRTKKCH